MKEQTNPSIKELVEKQGLTVRQLRTTLQRLENQDAGVLTCSNRECYGLGAYVVIG